MNVRDPFDLHRNSNSAAFNVLRLTATQAAAGIREKAVEVGTNALEKGRQAVEDMSFAVPKNVPSFANPQRLVEDQLWPSSGATARSTGGPRGGQPAGGLLGGVQNRVGGILNPDRNALPMYKDKPYAYAPSKRPRPLYRKKRVLGLLTLLCLVFLWYSGTFTDRHERAVSSLSRWGWLKAEEEAEAKGGKADWSKRRERVVEAFELSWDAYERYAWGKQSIPRVSPRRALLTERLA